MADMPLPESLTVHAASRVLEVGYSDGKNFRLPFELLRVYSPSAEVQGHGPGQEVLQNRQARCDHRQHRAGGQLRHQAVFQRWP